MAHKGKGKKINILIINCIFIMFCISCVIPFLLLISISLSLETDMIKYGYRFIPQHFTLQGYSILFNNPIQVINAYKVSGIVTLGGTLFSLLITSSLSYALSRKTYRFRNKLSFYVYFTMLFNGGMVPSYILVTHYLKLRDNLWALILPMLVNAWLVLILRTFMQTIPESLIESAKIDGASEFRIFSQLVLPLSKPGLATIGLFILLNYWNDWYLSLLYIDTNFKVPIQLLLYRIMSNLTFLTQNLDKLPKNINLNNMPRESTRMAMCLVAAGPVLFVFPFFQKYFVKGLTIGAVKG